MDVREYNAQKMSAACYEMARRYPNDAGVWTKVGTLWSLGIPRKNSKWEESIAEAKEMMKLLSLDQSAEYFGTHVMATKVTSISFSRSSSETAETFQKRFDENPSAVIHSVSVQDANAYLSFK